jgi:hypothetical protein
MNGLVTPISDGALLLYCYTTILLVYNYTTTILLYYYYTDISLRVDVIAHYELSRDCQPVSVHYY